MFVEYQGSIDVHRSVMDEQGDYELCTLIGAMPKAREQV